jgi:Ala-tRNA(Pro) deacylase
MNVHDFLDQRGVSYDPIPHRPTFEAQRLAEAVAVSGYEVAKPVLLRADGRYVLALVPAPKRIDLEKAQWALKARRVHLASEDEFLAIFPDCEVGAIPPFGSQYGLTTVIDESLAEDEEIIFEGNTHEEAFRMRFADFRELEHPHMADLTSYV